MQSWAAGRHYCTPAEYVSGDPNPAAAQATLSRERQVIRTDAAAAAAAAALGRSLQHVLHHWLSICSLLANDIVFAGCFEPPVMYAYLASRTGDSFLCNISHYKNGLN